MSELREAAERLRATGDTPNDLSVAAIYDRAILAKAWLAEHPADDDEAVTEEWLRSVGAEDLDEGIFRFTSKRGIEVFIWLPSRTVNFGDAEYRTPLKTRGEMRCLAKLLNIPLKESA